MWVFNSIHNPCETMIRLDDGWLSRFPPPPTPQNVAEFRKLNLKGGLWNTKHVELSKWEWDNVLEVALLYMSPFTQTANRVDEKDISKYNHYTVEPHYNEVLGTMKLTLLYQVSHYIRVKKTKKFKELGPAKWPCYKRVLLYPTSL